MTNTPHFTPLTNRNAAAADGKARFALPEDGFVQIVPVGRAPNVRHNGTKILQVVDEAAIAAMLKNAIAQGGELLIDFEHFSRESDKPTDAAAWLPLTEETLQNRGKDGLWGKPRWSTEGEASVTGGKLRFISPEFPDDDSALQVISNKEVRPLRLVGAGLTNRPNFRTTAKPLTNREGDDDHSSKPQHTMHKAILAIALGMTEAQIEAADETTLRNRATTTKKNADTAAELAAENTTLRNREVDAFMTQHDAVIPKDEELRKTIKGLVITNRAAADAMIAGFTPKKEEKKPEPRKQPLFNRENAQQPKDGDDAADETKARVIKNRADQLKAANSSRRFSDCFAQAEGEYESGAIGK